MDRVTGRPRCFGIVTFTSAKEASAAVSGVDGKVRSSFAPQSRGFHVDLGVREKALLADDPILKKFKSYKPTVRRIRKVGDVLTMVVAAACCYEIYQHAATRKAGYNRNRQS